MIYRRPGHRHWEGLGGGRLLSSLVWSLQAAASKPVASTIVWTHAPIDTELLAARTGASALIVWDGDYRSVLPLLQRHSDAALVALHHGALPAAARPWARRRFPDPPPAPSWPLILEGTAENLVAAAPPDEPRLDGGWGCASLRWRAPAFAREEHELAALSDLGPLVRALPREAAITWISPRPDWDGALPPLEGGGRRGHHPDRHWGWAPRFDRPGFRLWRGSGGVDRPYPFSRVTVLKRGPA